jgi:hypothetical protein
MRSNTNIELVHFEYGVSGRHSSERSGDRQPLPILFLRKKNFKKEVVIPRIRLKNRFWTMTATDIFIELVPEHLLKEKSRFYHSLKPRYMQNKKCRQTSATPGMRIH